MCQKKESCCLDAVPVHHDNNGKLDKGPQISRREEIRGAGVVLAMPDRWHCYTAYLNASDDTINQCMRLRIPCFQIIQDPLVVR